MLFLSDLRFDLYYGPNDDDYHFLDKEIFEMLNVIGDSGRLPDKEALRSMQKRLQSTQP